ncbi:MAG: hypothetical protein ACKO9F_21660, partial [Caldilinea sp.]
MQKSFLTAPWRSPLNGLQARKLREALLAYLFLLPAFLIVGLFGIFPLFFAAFMSTHRGLNRIPGTFDGLGNYLQAVGDFSYLLGFWGSLLLLAVAGRLLWQGGRSAREQHSRYWPWALPGVALGLFAATLIGWVFRLLPLLLEIPSQMRGARNTPETFRQLLGAALGHPQASLLLWLAAALLALLPASLWWIERTRDRRQPTRSFLTPFVAATLLAVLAASIGWLVWAELQKATAEALAQGERFDIQAQLLLVSVGFLLLAFSWWVWTSASHRTSMPSVLARLGGATLLMLGAWLLIAEAPRVLAQGDLQWWRALQTTFYYSLGTIPPQLLVALVLAVLLFQEIRGRSLFRVIYFLPYIAPFVGTAAVFKILFSNRPTAPANNLLAAVGLPPLNWINEPAGLFNLTLPGLPLPEWLAGPSLALAVIM